MKSDQIQNRFNYVKHLVGNTPMYSIDYTFKGEKRTIYAKAENLNMTGSIKDRMAFHILKCGYETGELKPEMMIAEATSGNTGIAISAIGRALGHPITIFMPDWMSSERINLIKSLGAKIHLISKEEGGFIGSIDKTKALAKTCDLFLPNQFSNQENANAHYESTGPEIWWQMRYNGLKPDAFIAGVGTGGTIMGAGKFLKEKNPTILLHPLEPSNSPTLSTGHKVGKHRIQGISDEFIPAIVDLDKLDDIVMVDDGDSIIMAQKLASELGLAVGISSGSNFLGAVQRQNKIGKDHVVVTVFSDDNKKYLSTDLLKQEPVKPDFLSTDIKLLNFKAIKRVCHLCCDPKECANFDIQQLSTEGATLPTCPHRHCGK
ncbi:MAG: cysteine synthase family protein [Desulfobacteraceae bacterium]|nr:cysteine synthase family protein [Desulfobacteraceae bacterium]